MSAAWIDFLVSLSAVALMLVLHGFLVMCEISLVKFRYGDVDGEALEMVKRRRGIARLIENGDRTGRVVRFSKTLCTVAVGLLLMPVVSVFFELFGSVQTPDRWLVVLLSFVCATSVHFLFAEIFPRGLAMRDPVQAIQSSYRVLWVFQILTLPGMLFFRGLKRVLFRRLGVDVEDELNPLDLDVQIRAMGEDSHELSPVVRTIVNRALQMQELVVQDVLLPRSQVVIYDLEEGFESNLEVMKQAGHTRFPLCRGNLDDCVGILHIKDMFRFGGALEELDPMKLKRTVAMFDLETPLEEALERMLRAKFHMALAVDEFGGIVGVVTFESILEELVGDIQDEFDSEEEQVRALRAPNTYRISGLTPIHDLEESLGLKIENEEVSTFGGLITGELGRIPARGDTLTIAGMQITVDEVDERRVIAAQVVYARP
ncbi:MULTISPECIES: hemolysin family protein [unclassified Lentimonas]|uniref:hemolysin family protein n=1 Tax=unclassified Lentimonas TaxID=2630993 RepID=UPI001326E9CA|nr:MULTISPECIES: hemolysin family protein [unclassified Lentimonas]CAA6679487.1 Magnesium and cobalt efflux protein CorC [Lentimonas sp. CC4]CAA6687158.1 Magnesium and cobalt efflux protein CorC [Lentimonas sp. CC6]CAA6691558.1 Magnesium and cobalt efflux protein CorC [Lentimonas sp. CC10]CAA6696222.1 Magnesium and cobalt efflux protein CorC [Lentimonas sp. CC19]CAA7070874.1 Magnesium and cobalt efflux protein CorC [Lentimonas sp. CC11]